MTHTVKINKELMGSTITGNSKITPPTWVNSQSSTYINFSLLKAQEKAIAIKDINPRNKASHKFNKKDNISIVYINYINARQLTY